MKEYFQNLKKRRQAKKLTLEDLHRKTRLPIHFLKAIEEGEFDKLPRGYERIYLKRFVQELGMDVEEVLRDFDVLTGRLTKPSGKPPEKEEAPPPKERPEKKEREFSIPKPDLGRIRSRIDSWNMELIHKYFWIGLGAVILLVAGYFTYQQYVLASGNDIQIKEIPVTDIASAIEKSDTTGLLKEKEKKVSAFGPAAGLKVELRAVERTWVKEIRDSKDTTDYILPVGAKRLINARNQILLRLGRADGVEVWLNGKNLGTMGRGDQVVTRLLLNSAGIVEKRMHTSIVPRRPSSSDSAAVPADSTKISIR